jgi:hypothetical protein
LRFLENFFETILKIKVESKEEKYLTQKERHTNNSKKNATQTTPTRKQTLLARTGRDQILSSKRNYVLKYLYLAFQLSMLIY